MAEFRFYDALCLQFSQGKKCLSILVDPDKFRVEETKWFINRIPPETTHLFVGGSFVENGRTELVVKALKTLTSLPIFLFPGDFSQITEEANALLYLSLLSGRNPEYLVGQQVKSISKLRNSKLEIIPTAYLLLDGGNESAVARISNTQPLSQENIELVIDTALAGQFMGAKLIYLEAGSGASISIKPEIISAVKKEIKIPLIVGGGIKTEAQKQMAYSAGADMIVLGTVLEEVYPNSFI